jgi:hypothetical protein
MEVGWMQTELEIYGVNIVVDYDYNAGEDMVMYYPDGSGHPGEPPSVEINEIYVGDVDIYELMHADMLDYIEQKLIEINY